MMAFAKAMVSEYTEKAANAAEGSADKRTYTEYTEHFAKQVERYEEDERIFARAEASRNSWREFNAVEIQRWWRSIKA